MLEGDTEFGRPVHSSAKELRLVGGTWDLTQKINSLRPILLNNKFINLCRSLRVDA